MSKIVKCDIGVSSGVIYLPEEVRSEPTSPAVAVPRSDYAMVRKMLVEIAELAELDSKNYRRATHALALLPEAP